MQDITLYALSTCLHCKNAKKMLEENHIEFDCVFVDSFSGEERKKLIAAVKEYNPKCSFPTLVIGGGDKVVVGFHRDKIKEALGI